MQNKNRVSICTNPLDPENWNTFECGDVREFLESHFGAWPRGARIYLNRVTRETDVTPFDKGGVERLGKLSGHFFVVVYPEGFAVVALVIAIAAAATSIALSFLLRPELPDPANQRDQSPTNSLTNRQNKERLGGRIPDIYGELWVTPDLIAYPYRIFIGNREVEFMYMCIGRGEFDIVEIRDDVTPLDQVDGAGAAVFGPYTSPNSGDSPQYEVGEPINTIVKNVRPHSSINGQTLDAPNAGKLKGDNNIRFVDDGSLECTNEINFLDYFIESTVANPRYVKISNSTYEGTYEISSVTPDKLTLDDPASVNAAWSSLSGETDYVSPILVRSSENWTGTFAVLDQTVTELWCNFVALRGLYKVDSNGNQVAVSATVQLEVTSIDNSYNPQGNPIYYQVTIQGSEILKNMIGVTLRASLPFAGACQVRARRLTNTDLRDGWSVVDEIQWRDMYVISPVEEEDFGNVTTLQTITWPTPSALSLKQRKINVKVRGIFGNSEIDAALDETPVVFDGPTFVANPNHTDPVWTFGSGGIAASQSENAYPSIILTDLDLNEYPNLIIRGAMTGTSDDDWMGFVFCYQDMRHFYLFDWRATDVGTEYKGMRVKKVNASSDLEESDLWDSEGTSKVTILDSNSLEWTLDQEYEFELELTEDGFTITITEDGTVLDTFVISDTTFTGGKFGLYNFSTAAEYRLLQTAPGSDSAAVKNAANCIIDMALDPMIGNRSAEEIDIDGINAVLGYGGEVESYFGTDLCTQFAHCFDDPKLSFEEMVSQLCQSVFCIPYRQGNVLYIKFEKEDEDSLILFNHRNKIPGSEKRTNKFGTSLENDGIELTYVEPNAPNAQNIDSAFTLYFPEDQSAVAAKKITAVGIRNMVQAWMMGWRLYQKLLYQKEITEFDATAEAGLCVISDRILVADNTRPETQDGEVLDQSGLELTLSQPVVFDTESSPLPSYLIFLQLYDGTVESIGVSAGSAANKVLLAEAPSQSLVTDETKYAKTTYVIVSDQDRESTAFILQEKETQDGGLYGIKAVNYDERYYDHDQDYAASPRLVDELTPGTGSGSGYDKQAQESVFVHAKCMPWSSEDNPSYDFGQDDGKQPVAVAIQSAEGEIVNITALAPGEPVANPSSFWQQIIAAIGTSVGYARTDTGADAYDAEGNDSNITADNQDAGGDYYPTKYALSPALGHMGLMGAWAYEDGVDGNGNPVYTVIEPFVIGFGGDFEVPAGGVDTLLLGINDTKFADNWGGFQVIVTQINAAAGDAAAADPEIDTETESDSTLYTFTINGV